MESHDTDNDKQINFQDKKNVFKDIVQNIENLEINTKTTDSKIIPEQITQFDEVKWLTGC